MLNAISRASQDLVLNGRWVIEVSVRDDDAYLVDVVPVVTVTSPTGTVTTPTVTTVQSGYYRASINVTSAGRYTATAVATGYGAAAFSAYVAGVSASSAFPDLTAVQDYLADGGVPVSTSAAVIQDALDAEAAAQRRVCDVPAIYGADLRQALLRRVAVNLAKRGLPLMVLRGDAEAGSLVAPGRDAEVRRLEGPYGRLVQP